MEGLMDWIDVSIPLHEDMAVFTGDPRFHIERTSSMADGAVCNVSRMDLGVHTGTHIDAPVHFLDGSEGAETIPLDALIGPAWVVDAGAAGPTITAEDVEGFDLPPDEVRLLLRTRSAHLWDAPAFDPTFVAPDATGAEALVRRGVRLVGMDYLSVAPFGDPTPTHRVLLSAGVVVVEGLDLRAVTPGPYELVCLPLRIVGSDGAPARALLRRRG
jgi:arylformamidase